VAVHARLPALLYTPGQLLLEGGRGDTVAFYLEIVCQEHLRDCSSGHRVNGKRIIPDMAREVPP